MKKLTLSYESSWRTKEDDKFMKSKDWANIRQRILDRDNYTCQYCNFKSEKGMQVNHINGNPKDNEYNNLEVICNQCHMILHSGLWCKVKGVIELYKTSKYDQNAIIKESRKLRGIGKSDEEIIFALGLSNRTMWKQDLKYLSKLFGFITSNKSKDTIKPNLTEDEQKSILLKSQEII